jgi:hypothetical protein
MKLRFGFLWFLAGTVAASAFGCLGGAFNAGTGGGTSSASGGAGSTSASSSHSSSGVSASSSSGPSTCPGAKTMCSTGCVDVKVDVNNCGGCGRSCTNTQVCNNGNCDCRPGFTSCGVADGGTGNPNVCVDLQHDPKHCGSCTNGCPGDKPVCQPGMTTVCMASCQSGTLCGDGCYESFDNTQLHCGACNTPCSNAQVCAGTMCEGAYIAQSCAGCVGPMSQCCMTPTLFVCISPSMVCPTG